MKNRSQKIMRISTVTALTVWAVLMVLLFRNMGNVSLHELLTYQPEKPVLAALAMLLLFALKSMDAVIHCGVLFAATGLMLPLPLRPMPPRRPRPMRLPPPTRPPMTPARPTGSI